MTDDEALARAIHVLKAELLCTNQGIRYSIGNTDYMQAKLIELGDTISQLENLKDRLQEAISEKE